MFSEFLMYSQSFIHLYIGQEWIVPLTQSLQTVDRNVISNEIYHRNFWTDTKKRGRDTAKRDDAKNVVSLADEFLNRCIYGASLVEIGS